MFLEDTWKLPAFSDECFTSWLFRTTLGARSDVDKDSIYRLFESWGDAQVFDPDHCMDGIKFESCCSYISIDPREIRKQFWTAFSWVIPRQLRTSYCITCMQESILTCGLPTYNRAWGCMQMPFCMRHKILLRDGSLANVHGIASALSLFKNHWRDSRLNEYIPEYNLPWLHLAFRTQKVLSRNRRLHEYLAYKILLQLFLWPDMYFTAGEWSRNLWSKSVPSYLYIKPSALSLLQGYPLHACTITRAKGLCYLGRIMKLVSDKELDNAFRAYIFAPKGFEEMVAHISASAISPVVRSALYVLRCVIDENIEDDVISFIRRVTDGAKI